MGGKAEISELNWSSWDFDFDQLVFTEGKSFIKKAEIKEFESGIKLGSILSESLEIRPIKMGSMHLEIGAADPDYVPPKDEEPTGLAAYLPQKNKLNGFEISSFSGSIDVSGESYSMSGVRVNGEVSGEKNLNLELQDGELQLPLSIAKSLKHQSSNISLIGGDIELEDGEFLIYGDSPLKLDAFFGINSELYKVNGVATEVDIEPFITPGLKRNISGVAEVDFKYVSKKGEEESTTGNIIIEDCVVKGLEVLKVLEAYTNNIEYRQLKLNVCKADFLINKSGTHITNIMIDMNRSLSIRGEIHLTEDDSLNGVIQLGLPRGTLKSIPGAEKKVFLPGDNGMNWATIRLSGSLNNIQEDLTTQLVSAAAGRMLEIIPEIGGTINDLISKGQLPEDILSPGKVMGDVAKAGTNILESFLKPNVTDTSKQFNFSKNGTSIKLSDEWKLTQNSVVNEPIATIEVDGKIAAQLYLIVREGDAKTINDAWSKAHPQEKFKSSELLTDQNLAAIQSTIVDANGKFIEEAGIAKSAMFIQLNKKSVVCLRVDTAVKDAEAANKHLIKIGNSVSEEKKQEDDTAIDKIDELIPGTKTLEGLIPF